jgi:hypothetical protein
MKRTVTLIGMLCFAASTFSQDGSRLLNTMKADLLGSILILSTSRWETTPWRASLQYERKLGALEEWSVSGGVEYMQYAEYFAAMWSYQPPYSPYQNWIDGLITHHQFSIVGGIRWYRFLFRKGSGNLGWFVEPRMGWSWRWGRKLSLLVDGSCCDHDVREMGISPRLMSGFQWRLDTRFFMEAFGELFYQKLMGAGKHQWNILPGFSFGFAF